MIRYGPPMSDSDSDDDSYDGFSFGSKIGRVKIPKVVPPVDPHQALYDAILDNNLIRARYEIRILNFCVNDIILNETTLLNLACQRAFVNIVEYLIDEGANVNAQVDLVTPLIEICKFKTENLQNINNVLKIVSILLDNGAVINVCDKYGMSPFLHACGNGYIEVLKILMPHISLETKNNQGQTALFIAIENNQMETVKYLLENNINTNVFDNKGNSPRLLAECLNLTEILEILPIEDTKYVIPPEFLSYGSLTDHMPKLFEKRDVPEYFQDVYQILRVLNLLQFTEYFAKANITLSEFLAITDERLNEIGIVFPYQRNKVRMGLLYYHIYHWNKKTLLRLNSDNRDDFKDVLMFVVNNYKNTISINAALKYVGQNLENSYFGNVEHTQILKFKKSLESYKTSLNNFKTTLSYLKKFSPEKSPIYIDYDEYVAAKNEAKTKRYTTFGFVILGFSLFLIVKFKFM